MIFPTGWWCINTFDRCINTFDNGAKNPLRKRLAYLNRRLKNGVGAARISRGRNEKTSFVIVDAQSVKNTDPAEQKGYDAGKKISSIKHHRAVDTQGLPHAIAITTADVIDRKGALVAFSEHQDSLSAVTKVLVDGGHTGQPFANAVHNLLGATVTVAKRNELRTFAVLPNRWVVKRSFA